MLQQVDRDTLFSTIQFLDSKSSSGRHETTLRQEGTSVDWNLPAKELDMDVSENSGTPKSSILIGFSITNHPFGGTTIFGNTHISPNLARFSELPQVGYVSSLEGTPPHLLKGKRSQSNRIPLAKSSLDQISKVLLMCCAQNILI